MKKIYKDRIINIEKTDVFDNTFLFDYLDIDYVNNSEREIIYLSELLEQRKNHDLLKKVSEKPAMYSNVYSPEDELELFTGLFEYAIKNDKKIHIVGITLKEEVEMLEKYYDTLWFLREDINCFTPDFSVPLITVSVNIENIMWKGSDYKAMKEQIFFNPPIRESGQVKAMFKWINRGVIAGIHIKKFTTQVQNFLEKCIREEIILPITLAKVLKYNIEDIWMKGENKELVIKY